MVRVFDVGTPTDGSPYIAMEYLEGDDLDQMLQQRGPLPLGEALECLLQACEGIGEAHAVGVVHRDLKPANLVRCERTGAPPFVKVVDFGISKLLTTGGHGQDPVVTAPNEILGSPLYAPPEQLRAARDADARADIWALGAVGYALLAGRPPFEAPTYAELCALITEATPVPLTLLRRDVPPELAAVFERCLAKAPEARFQTVGELARALAPFAPPRAVVCLERIASLQPPPPGPADVTCHDGLAVADPLTDEGRPGGVLRWAVASALVSVLVVSGIVVAWPGASSVSHAPMTASASHATALGTTLSVDVAMAPPASTPVVSIAPLAATTATAASSFARRAPMRPAQVPFPPPREKPPATRVAGLGGIH